MKIVINKCFGGFSLSHEGVMRYAELKGIALYPWLDDITRKIYGERAVIGNDELVHHYSTVPVGENGENYSDKTYFPNREIDRSDMCLVKVIEELGNDANGPYAKLVIVDIPDGVDWYIDEYDGLESIHERHQSWG